MLQGKRQNTHHSKLPPPGGVGRIVGLSTVDPRRKCIVSHYPLCDNVMPFSRGIHTVFIRFLDNSEIARFSGIWFEAWE
ncbi:MAG: hypothetical protein SGJ24_19430 [Chloroflexota bacterium]|nr:hypothetical protein [Chloroflexota bacterium]